MTVAAVAVLPPCAAPPASAVSPPPIDDTRLPMPAPPKPPQSTVQREMCAVPSLDPKADTSHPTGFDLQQVWRLTRGSGQRVAVLDTGVAPNPRLPHLSAGGDYVSAGDGTQDCDGHGTAVAGIIAATTAPTDDFSGVAPDATVATNGSHGEATNGSLAKVANGAHTEVANGSRAVGMKNGAHEEAMDGSGNVWVFHN